MTPELIISLVVSAVLAIFASVTAPLILAHRTEQMHREDREADWKRQDQLAAAARQAAAAEAARAAAAARELLASNQQVAASAEVTNGKLDAIHVLVNSNLTAEMQARYDATKRELAVLRELMELKRANGLEPTAEVLAEIDAAQASLNELGTLLADRREAQDKASRPPPPNLEGTS